MHDFGDLLNFIQMLLSLWNWMDTPLMCPEGLGRPGGALLERPFPFRNCWSLPRAIELTNCWNFEFPLWPLYSMD